jgi:cell division protein FtsI (penicillin-binding protein 3)
MREMLVSVTEGEGTGVEAAIPGFTVAGKTATAQKIDPETGRYTDTHYVASFVGFVPANAPRLVVSVVIDEPMAGTTSGGAVAAPVFRRVAEMSLRYLGVRPKGTQSMKLADVAQYTKGEDPAQQTYSVINDDKEDREVTPPDNSGVANNGRRGRVRVPELNGLPMRAAIQTVVEAGLVPVVDGSGLVLRTEPPEGKKVPKGSKIVLVFEPQT